MSFNTFLRIINSKFIQQLFPWTQAELDGKGKLKLREGITTVPEAQIPDDQSKGPEATQPHAPWPDYQGS